MAFDPTYLFKTLIDHMDDQGFGPTILVKEQTHSENEPFDF